MKKAFLILSALLLLGTLAIQAGSPFYDCMLECNHNEPDKGKARSCRYGCAFAYNFPVPGM